MLNHKELELSQNQQSAHHMSHIGSPHELVKFRVNPSNQGFVRGQGVEGIYIEYSIGGQDEL